MASSHSDDCFPIIVHLPCENIKCEFFMSDSNKITF